MKTKHPMQPLEKDKQGIIRFKQNKIVRFLLDAGRFDLNQLAREEFSDEDRMQFAQLIGYSVRAYGELSYVSDESYDEAVIASAKLDGQKVYDVEFQRLKQYKISICAENADEAEESAMKISDEELERMLVDSENFPLDVRESK